jgi:hypothetical protein
MFFHLSKYVVQQQSKEDKPINFVFHGGSGSEKDKIELALKNGVIKMNIDTDIQVRYNIGRARPCAHTICLLTYLCIYIQKYIRMYTFSKSNM